MVGDVVSTVWELHDGGVARDVVSTVWELHGGGCG